jgi:hypothetical protein
MKVGDLVRLKNPAASEKDLVGILAHLDGWRPVGTVYWSSTYGPKIAVPPHDGGNVYLRDIELIKQAKVKAI